MITTWIGWLLLFTVCLAGMAVALEPLVRSAKRAGRWVWVGVFVAAVVGPVVVAVRPEARVAVAPVTIPAPTGGVAPLPVAGPSLDVVLGVAWLALSAGMLALLLAGLAHLARERRRATRERIAGCDVALTSTIGPGAVPFGHPRILVPRWIADLPASAVHGLVLHEAEHVRVGDARLLVGAVVVVSAMPWNPALWYALRRLRTAIELDCDARVLAQGMDVRAYAQLLLQVAARGTRRPLPPLLALASGTTQLETRIDAMTTTRRLTRAQRTTMMVAAAALALLACEARRPAPVAPVTDYTVKDGKTLTLTFDGREADSVKVALSGAVPDSLAFRTVDDRSEPLVLVLDATGKTVFTGRMGPAVQPRLEGARDAIASVDVYKRGDLLPPEAPAGLIRVVLKPGATFPGAATDSAAGVFYRSPAPSGATGPTPSSDAAPRRQAGPAPQVLLYDGAGALLYTGPMGAKGDEIGPYLVPPADIARVDVNKDPTGTGTITVRLKPGVTLVKR